MKQFRLHKTNDRFGDPIWCIQRKGFLSWTTLKGDYKFFTKLENAKIALVEHLEHQKEMEKTFTIKSFIGHEDNLEIMRLKGNIEELKKRLEQYEKIYE